MLPTPIGATLSIKVNQTMTLSAQVLDDAGNVMILDNPIWTSSDSTVLLVVNTHSNMNNLGQATIRGVSAGSTTLTINSKGLTKIITVTVTNPIPTSLNIYPLPIP